MAAPNPTAAPVGPDTLITIKVIINGNNRRFKLALRDLGANVLPQKLRFLLAVPPDVEVKFDRFSDSAGAYVTLDSDNPAVYKQLYRAAKAKLKLRLRATVLPATSAATNDNIVAEQPPQDVESANPASQAQAEPRQSFLETVLSPPPMPALNAPSFKAFQHARPIIASDALSAALASVRGQLTTMDDRASVLSKPTIPTFHDFPSGTFTIDCNQCGKSIPNEHYHCGICERGDFDLCPACVDQGVTCEGDDHWLIKRTIQDGIVVPSFTERLAPKKSKSLETMVEPPQNPTSARIKTVEPMPERTCNSCIRKFPEFEFVTCKDCPDFDLCHVCFQIGEHGHHPAHTFQPVDDCYYASELIRALCEPGRGLVHDAVCDGCDKRVTGVRYKCLTCPDWDYCSICVLSAQEIHPGHRFAPLYEPLGVLSSRPECHYGIYCDGPLCASKQRKTYVRGDRYKCAVCHDTDFCANCEAMPTNTHNKTHPLIKFKTFVRRVSVTTLGETGNGDTISQMGDRPRAKNAATETTHAANAPTQVQTVAEVKPAEPVLSEPANSEVSEKSGPAGNALQAKFEFDSTPDGTRFAPNRLVAQSWTLRNTGTQAWPVGCAVYYIGGDDMRNLDANHPSSISDMAKANRSNVLDHGLEPGQTATFEVLLKSPQREGRAISYWRLKTPEGLPFGHKLWVDITVAVKPAEVPVKTEEVEVPKTMEAAVPTSRHIEIESQESSTMIFPQLEKESPESSMHEASEAPSAATAPTVKNEDQDLLEDIESLELDDEDTDDGFMTDEEYDILDASDEDFLMEAQNAVAKK